MGRRDEKTKCLEANASRPTWSLHQTQKIEQRLVESENLSWILDVLIDGALSSHRDSGFVIPDASVTQTTVGLFLGTVVYDLYTKLHPSLVQKITVGLKVVKVAMVLLRGRGKAVYYIPWWRVIFTYYLFYSLIMLVIFSNFN